MKLNLRKKGVTALFLIIALAFLLRVVSLGNYPVGFTPDEASFGYDAYSLLQTGKDQWGEAWPLSLRSFGDFKPPLYAYLTMPSVAIFGLNETATRLPNAIFGVLAVITTFYAVRRLFGDERVAYVSSFLLAISPWHVALSRGAFEANLTVFFMTFGVLTFYKGLKDKKWMVISALSFGLNLFSYHSARMVAPLILGFLIFWEKKELGIKSLNDLTRLFKKYLTPSLIFLVFLFAAFYTVASGGASRAGDVTIFNPTDEWMGVFDRRYDAVFEGLPYTPARFFSNKVVHVFDRFTNSYLTYLSPQFLFTLGPAEWTYGMIAGRGVLYFVEMLFVLTSVWYLIKNGFKKERGIGLIVFWLLVSPIPAALTKGPGYAGNRAAVMMPAIQIFSAFGAVYLYDILAKRFKKNLVFAGFFFVIFLSFLFFAEDYIYHAPRNAAGAMLYGRKEAVEFADRVEDNYAEIVFSRSLSEPQIYIGFYQKWDPETYQKASEEWLEYEEKGLPFVDQLGEYYLGKYTFRNINYSTDKELEGRLFVGKKQEFPVEIDALEIISYPNEDPAVIIFDPAKTSYAKKDN